MQKIAFRRGKKRASVAVAHAILKIVYHMLKDHRPYQDLGGAYFDRLDPARFTRYLVRRLERLGHVVTLRQLQPKVTLSFSRHRTSQDLTNGLGIVRKSIVDRVKPCEH